MLDSTASDYTLSQLSLTTIPDHSSTNIAARVESMSEAEQLAWAQTVTLRVTDEIVQAGVAKIRFADRCRVLSETLREAMDGGAWRIKGYDSFREYCEEQFTVEKIFQSRGEQDELIRILHADGFSQSSIAGFIGMTQSTVSYHINKQDKTSSTVASIEPTGMTGGQGIEVRYPDHPGVDVSGVVADSGTHVVDSVPSVESLESTPSKDAGDGGVKSLALDGKTYAMPRTREGLIADWLWFMALKEMEGLSRRQIEAQYGIPGSTVSTTLTKGRPTTSELVNLWLNAKHLRDNGIGMAGVANQTGLRLNALHYLLTDTQTPKLRDLINVESLFDWETGDGYLKLVDGTTVTQTQVAQLIGRSQPTVSAALNTWLEELGIQHDIQERDHNAGEPDLTSLTDTTLHDINNQHAEQLERDYWRQARIIDAKIIDPSPSIWAERIDTEAMELNPGQADGTDSIAWLSAFARTTTHMLTHTLTPLNIACTYPHLIDRTARKELLDTLTQLTDIFTRQRTHIEASLDTEDHAT